MNGQHGAASPFRQVQKGVVGAAPVPSGEMEHVPRRENLCLFPWWLRLGGSVPQATELVLLSLVVCPVLGVCRTP